MNEMTDLENKVYDFIKENSEPETMTCVDINDLSKGLNESPNVLRGVLSSLVKKDMIEVEEFERARLNGSYSLEYYYWLKGAFND